MMRALLLNVLCGKCKSRFKAPGLPEGVYGEFILRSRQGEVVYLNSLEDQEFNEVRVFFNEVKSQFKKITKSNEMKIFKAVYSIACDKSPKGQVYRIGMDPMCPECGANEMAAWSETNPYEFTPEIIGNVTHREWSKLNLQEKRVRVEQGIKEEVDRLCNNS